MMFKNSRELGHRTPIPDGQSSCPIVDHQHHHHQLATTGPPIVNLDAIRSKSNTTSFQQLDQHNGRGDPQDCNGEEQKLNSMHPSGQISYSAVPTRSSRFHPYAQQMANRIQLADPYASSPFTAGPPQAAVNSLRHHHPHPHHHPHHHHQQQQQQQQQLTSPMNASYPVSSRLHYQQPVVAAIQQHTRNHHQFMRATNVYPQNSVTDRCRHARSCLCMLLPMNHHHHHSDILPAAPLFQLVKNFNHPRSPGNFNGNSSNHNNSNSGSSNNNNNNNSNNSCNNITDNIDINNNANTNNKKKC